jgi:hypothetical protein
VAAKVLESLGIPPDAVRQRVVLTGLGADYDRSRELVVQILDQYRREHGLGTA